MKAVTIDRDEVLREYRDRYPTMLTIGMAAELAGRPRKTIYEWSHLGLLDGCKVPQGKEIRIGRDCFVTLLLNGLRP